MSNNVLHKILKFKREHLRLHPEGRRIIYNTIVFLIIINGLLFVLSLPELLFTIVNIISIGLFALIVYFFRNPVREVEYNDTTIYAPADGKVVVIEEAPEDEYLKEKRIQVSIFMSPLNVHVNRMPVTGTIEYYKYHPGLFLVAWHPKSSTDNERTSVVLKTTSGISIMLRQIAGAMARRIVCYANEGKSFKQGEDIGFIKFGSRVDLFLPLNSDIKVSLGETVFGNKTVIAKL